MVHFGRFGNSAFAAAKPGSIISAKLHPSGKPNNIIQTSYYQVKDKNGGETWGIKLDNLTEKIDANNNVKIGNVVETGGILNTKRYIVDFIGKDLVLGHPLVKIQAKENHRYDVIV